MRASTLIRRARRRAGLSLRDLARRAGTSHATVSAYEAGRKIPTVATLDRLVRACGLRLRAEITPDPAGPDPEQRGRELAQVLALAEKFPARHAIDIEYPPFGMSH
ncbi:MAG: helix-turn-helix transcriptional regulator [Acidimicrobiia bacterium]